MGPRRLVSEWSTKTEGTLELLLGSHKAIVIKGLKSDGKLS